MAGSGKGIKGFPAYPFTAFGYENRSNSMFKRGTLRRGHVTGESIVIITRGDNGNEEPIHDAIWK